MENKLSCEEHGSEGDSYEFIDGNKAVDINDSSIKGAVVQFAEVQLSPKETFLANRVRELQQENDDLKKAIQINGDALKLCVNDLNTWKDQQNESHNTWCEKYELAHTTVTKLQNEISNLKQEIQAKQANPNDSIAEIARQDFDELPSLQGEQINKGVGCLEKHINQFLNLSDDDRQELAIPGSTFFQDFAQICEEVQKAMELRLKPTSNPFEEELTEEKTKCNFLKESLEQEKLKQLILEKQNTELEKRIDAQIKVIGGFVNGGRMGDINELNEAVQLLGLDMTKMEKLTAGCVSHGSETPGESFAVSQGIQEKNSSSTDSIGFDEEIRALKNLNTTQGERIHRMQQHETFLLNGHENALTEKKNMETKLLESEEEKSKLQKLLEDISENNRFLKVEIKKKEDEIEDLVERQCGEEIAKKQEMSERTTHQIETLKSQVCFFHEEIQAKEKEADVWRVQELDYQQSIRNMEITFSKVKEDLNFSQSALIETRNELASVYHQHEKLLAENQSVRGSSGAEIVEYQSNVDSLTAQLLSAEEMVENKDQDYRKLQQDYSNLTSELETIPLLQQQVNLFQRDFDAEKQARREREDECRRLKEELMRIRGENEKLMEDLNDPTGSRMAELQRRHGSTDNSWNVLYDQFLAPRGPPSRNVTRQSETDLNRQVSGGCCPKCERVFPDLDALQTHVVQCLESDCNSTGVERVCPKCQESFPDLDTLQIHVMECLDD